MTAIETSPTALDRAKGLAAGALGLLIPVGYMVGGQWRSWADYGYTLALAGIVAMFLWMMLAPGKWEESIRDGQKIFRRFANRYPRFLTHRLTGWAMVAMLGVNVIGRTVEHLT